jgi:glyoxylase-like metal-dependent hydrolase (beta-lactamase superfamily II)
VFALAGADAVLCDPALAPEDIDDLAAAANRAAERVYVVITHADFDHTCGIGFFPDATVVAGEDTARAIESGSAAQALAEAGREWGAAWPGDLRVDRTIAPGEYRLGPFRIEALEASGHAEDGLAFVLVDQGVMLPGDYLSAMTYPFLTGSLASAKATHERLLNALDRYDDLRWVVPGHGPALAPGEARAIGEADAAYLDALEQAAREAHAGGESPGRALVSVFGILPPRATTEDFEVYGIRAANARKALAEAGGA